MVAQTSKNSSEGNTSCPNSTVKAYAAASRIPHISLRARDTHHPIPNPPRVGSKPPQFPSHFAPNPPVLITMLPTPTNTGLRHQLTSMLTSQSTFLRPSRGWCPGLHVRSRRPQCPTSPNHGPACDAAATSLHRIILHENPNPSPHLRLPTRLHTVLRRLERGQPRPPRGPPSAGVPRVRAQPPSCLAGGRLLEQIEAAQSY